MTKPTKPLPHPNKGYAAAPDGTAVLVSTAEGSSMRELGGSACTAFNTALVAETIRTLFVVRTGKPEDAQRETRHAMEAATAALEAFKPADEIEGMLAAQAVAAHFGAMECYRRAMVSGQPAEVATRLRRDAANLSRTMADMLAALDRKRGRSPQVIRVEKLVVQDGGRAVVANVRGAEGTQQLSVDDPVELELTTPVSAGREER